MTAPDSLEKIVEDLEAWGCPQFAARIEALIPSKAEREFMEVARHQRPLHDHL